MADSAFQKPPLDREPDPEPVGFRDHLGIGRDRRRFARSLGREELDRVGVAGVGKDLCRAPGLDDFAVLHHADPIGDPAHDGQVVGDEEHRHALGRLQLCQKLKDLGLDRDVERRGGFVGDQEVGAVGERHGDHHPLPLPARKLVGIGAEAAFRVLDPHLVKEVQHPTPRVRTGNALVEREAFGKLLFQRVERVEGGHRLLEDEADIVAADIAEPLFAGAHHLLAIVADGAGDGGAVAEERDGRKRRHRFAGARFADERHRLALGEAEGDALHGLGHGSVLAEADPKVADVENRGHWKVFLGSKASLSPSKMKTRSESMMAKVKNAVNASQGAWRFCLA